MENNKTSTEMMEQSTELQTEDVQTEGQETGEQDQEKTFTQDEVNEIVKKRLIKEQKRFQADSNKRVEAREKAVQEREMQLLTKEKLLDNNLPKELATVISAKDEASLDNVIDILNKHFHPEDQEEEKRGFRSSDGKPVFSIGGKPTKKDESFAEVDPARKAMGLK